MLSLLLRWIAIFVAVLLTTKLLPDFVTAQGEAGAALFAAILALLNIFVRPILKLVTAPVTCLTLGLFVVVVNAFLYWLASQLSGSAVQVHGFLGALVGALVVSVVSMVVARLS